MLTLTASVPLDAPPAWAVLERALFDLMDRSVHPFLEKYTRPDGTLIWADRWSDSRDGADDFYESSYNWPLYYLLGGGDHLLTQGQRQWDAITKQLTELGPVLDEYERGYDQFHQSESYIYFYFLCLADPTNERNRERAVRFAGLYLNENPDAPNYDPERKLIRAPHNGSGGPRWGHTDSPEPSYGWSASMRTYGLPYTDIEGVREYDDLKDPTLSRRMGEAMQERMGKGDVAGNLMVTSLIANAFLLTGEEKYRRWIVEYVDAWRERAADSSFAADKGEESERPKPDGLLPDNVGLSGEVGEYMDGRWYGGLYGWSWPHGYYNIGMAATVSGGNVFLLTGDETYLQLARDQYDAIWDLGEMRSPGGEDMSLRSHWVDQLDSEQEGIFVVPYRHNDEGWFDYQPMSPVYPAAVWNMTMDPADWQRIETLRRVEKYDWRRVQGFRNKEDNGHEQPWLRFLAGDNPEYPEQMLASTYGQVCRRLALIQEDEEDLTQVHIHHWQQLNPVITEALVQLTLGAPQIIYNGGLLHCRLRYYDADRRRPGLPADVAALVSRLEADRTVVELVNLSPYTSRTVLLQAGGFGEHRFETVRYTKRTSIYPGPPPAYQSPEVEHTNEEENVGDVYLQVELPPATQIELDISMARYVNEPSCNLPW
ncbi:MAG: hypothetical protein OXI80_08720 [Caldilineaceae bacterium]|nr:hypothetical protein [Caldilineaceae bacterium]MDE0337741.1 hypothetical protein [Caldilineaceae bacterium]